MSSEYRGNFLDIGGGPDISLDPDTVTRLRAVTYAKNNPGFNCYVLDPNLPERHVLNSIREIVPNVHFVAQGIDQSSHIPFKDSEIDAVEMNFIFTDLSAYRDGKQVPQEEFETWKAKELTSPSDAPLYAYAIREASRVLKAGGSLVIAEKKQRMDRITRLLSSNNERMLDSEFLRECGLQFVGLTEITDPNRSWWTSRRLREKAEYEKENNYQKVEESRVFALEFKKI